MKMKMKMKMKRKFKSMFEIERYEGIEGFFDEGGVRHSDERFIGVCTDGFYYCDPSTGELAEIDLYRESGEQIDFKWFWQENSMSVQMDMEI